MSGDARSNLKAIAYWLIPAAAERDLFRDLIAILAKQLDAPRFEPHLTLFVARDNEAPGKILRRVELKPIRLRVRHIGWSAEFTKTLFIRFEPAATLSKMAMRLAGEANEPMRAVRDPHVSLLYKTLPPRIKRDLAATIELPFRDAVFDSIQAVRCCSPTKTKADVESWRQVAARKLR